MSAMLMVTASSWAHTPATSTVSVAGLSSGIDERNFDLTVSPKHDFYQHVNGSWIKSAEIPGDSPTWGTFIELREKSVEQIHEIVEELAKKNLAEDSVDYKVAALYASFMDEAAVEAAGLTPLQSTFDRIERVKNPKQFAQLLGHLSKMGVTSPISGGVSQDLKNAEKHMAGFRQSGLGLPERDYYLKDDEKLSKIREQYVAYIEKLLTLTGEENAAEKAKQISDLETEIAKLHWTNVENRNYDKMYNKYAFKDLKKVMPNFDWTAYLKERGIYQKSQDKQLILAQLSYFQALDQLLKDTPLDTWKTYSKFHTVNGNASYLSQDFQKAQFDFYRKTLRGVTEERERWKQGVDLVNGVLGEAVGQVYVSKHFTEDKKQRMQALVDNLIKTYDQSIIDLAWMSDSTKVQAREKLKKMTVKVGYPDKWEDYSKLNVKKQGLVENLVAASLHAHEKNVNKLRQPVDHLEWSMTPQTVNAYYHPMKNEIVFPAAILQAPFFDMAADDAVNYGAIGGVIGHEISHGFDDQGSRFDADGNMRNWWSEEDHAKFKAKTQALIDQYSQYEVLPGYFVNGALGIGENIADNSGLAIAYKAYQLSLNGQPAPVINGLTGDQRFFMGWAQGWRSKEREEYLLERLKVGPHSPSQVRGNGAVVNQDPFFDAFGIKEGDKMYVAPEKRVKIW